MTKLEFKIIRIRLEMTQAEYAKALGYSREHISRLETGDRQILDSIAKKAKELLK